MVQKTEEFFTKTSTCLILSNDFDGDSNGNT